MTDMQTIEGLIKDVEDICYTYLTDDEKIYYGGENEWYKFDDIYEFNGALCWMAAKNGWLDLLIWALKPNKELYYYHNVCMYAVQNGHLDIVKWLKMNGYLLNCSISPAAATSGQLEVLKWGIENGDSPYDKWQTVFGGYASRNKHIEILKWAHEPKNDYKFDRYTCYYAKQNGNLEILNWIKDNGCECNGEFHKN